MLPNELTYVFIGALGFLCTVFFIKGRNWRTTNFNHALISLWMGVIFGLYTWIGFGAIVLSYIIPFIILALHKKRNQGKTKWSQRNNSQ